MNFRFLSFRDRNSSAVNKQVSVKAEPSSNRNSRQSFALLCASVLGAFALGTTAFAAGTNFNTPGIYTYTFGATASQVQLTVTGAGGGNGSFAGGSGATLSGGFPVNPGDVLTVIVGGTGAAGASGIAAGGGGGSAVVLNGTNLLVAAGGGGGSGVNAAGGGALANLASTPAGGPIQGTYADGFYDYSGGGGGGFGAVGGTLASGKGISNPPYGGTPAQGGAAASLTALSAGGAGSFGYAGYIGNGGNGGAGFGGGGGSAWTAGGGGGGYQGGQAGGAGNPPYNSGGGDSFFNSTLGFLSSAAPGNYGTAGSQPNNANGVVTVVYDAYKSVSLPTVYITNLLHESNSFGIGAQISDFIGFSGGVGSFSGPGFSAAFFSGDTVKVSYSAPPGKQFVLRPNGGRAFFVISGNWRAPGAVSFQADNPTTITFENLQGPSPIIQYPIHCGVTDGGAQVRTFMSSYLDNQCSFSAITFEFQVPGGIAGNFLNFGSITDDGGYPSFGARVDYSSDPAPNNVIMAIENIPAPAIVVQQPAGNSLVPGALVDFGTNAFGSVTPKTFVVANSGNLNLTGISVTRDGTGAASFTQTDFPATTLAPGESAQLGVNFAPASSGRQTATLHFLSTDPQNSPFDVQLTGVARPVAFPLAVTVIKNDPTIVSLRNGGVTGTPTYKVTAKPSHGTLNGIDSQGFLSVGVSNVTYRPNAGYLGLDSFAYTVNDGLTTSDVATVGIAVVASNLTPVAKAQALSLLQGGFTNITLVGSDPDGPTPNFIVTQSPAQGTLSGVAPNLIYTPNPSFSGSDSFTFVTSDGIATSATALVDITVVPVAQPPRAFAQTLAVDQDTPLPITLTGTVPSGPINFVIGSYPAHGTVSGTLPNIVYTPTASFSGKDSIAFRVNNGSVTSALATASITVRAVNLPPTAHSGNVSVNQNGSVSMTLTGNDPEGKLLRFTVTGRPKHGTLNGWGYSQTYSPTPGYYGSDSIEFMVDDGVLKSGNAPVNITVNRVNQPPQAQDQSVTLQEDTPTPIALLSTDVDGPVTNYTIVTPPVRGSLSGSGRTVTYTPAANYFGSDSFTFKVNDGSLTSAVATVSLKINPVVDPQTTIFIRNLVDRGLDFGNEGGYKIPDVYGTSDFHIDDIRPKTNNGVVTWQANGGGVNIYGPGLQIDNARMQDGKLLLNGKLSFLPTYITDEIGDKFSTDCSVYVDRNGKLSLAGGTVCFPKKIAIPSKENQKLVIQDVCVTINPTEKTYGGSAKIGFGLGNAGNFCPGATVGPPLFGATVLVRDGKFDTFGLSVNNLRKPLGQTGAFLDGVSGLLANVTRGSDWYVKATIEINAGCPISFAGATIYPATFKADGKIVGTGYVEINGQAFIFKVQVAGSYLRYSPPYNIALGSFVNFGGVLTANFKASVSPGPSFTGEADGKLGIPKYVPIVGGFTFAQAYAAVNNGGFRGNFALNITPEIPSVCSPRICFREICPGKPCWCCWCRWCFTPPCIPSICTPRIPAISARVGFKYESGNFSFSTSDDPQVEPWEVSYHNYVYDQQTGNRFSFMNNWSRIDKASTGKHGHPFGKRGGQAVTTFNVNGADDSEIFRLTYSNTNVTDIAMTLDTPDVSGLDVNAGPLPYGYTNLSGSFGGVALDRQEAYFWISKPKAGAYTIHVDSKDLGDFAVEQLSQNPSPTVAIKSVESSTVPGTYVVHYTSLFSTNSMPTTSIYLTHPSADYTHKSGATFLLSSNVSVYGTNDFVFDASHLDLPPGTYKIAVNVSDPASIDAEALSREDVTIANPQAPLPVTHIATDAGDGSFTVAWDPSPSSKIVSYVVLYTSGNEPYDFEHQTNVDNIITNISSLKVTGLTNGQPYLVTVVAVNEAGFQSDVAEVIRVVPTPGPGQTPPVIVSSPNVGATANQPYIYVLQSFDGDDASLRNPLRQAGGDIASPPYDVDQNGLHWELVQAPAGMTILPNGIIMWTPTDLQVGDHTVTVRASKLATVADGAPLVAQQTYTVTVVESWNISGGVANNHFGFLSRPVTTATENVSYLYTPTVLINGESYAITVLEGPAGMQVTNSPDGLDTVVWDVPSGAQGQRVRLRAAPRNAVVTEADYVYQEFYLSVQREDNTLPHGVAPVAGTDVIATDMNKIITVPLSRLLLNDFGPAAGPIDIISAANGAHGTVAIVGNNLVYTPAVGFSGTDSFTYVLSDGANTSKGTVNVTVRSGQGFNMLNPVLDGHGNVIVGFGGISGRTYVVQFATSPAGPWTDLPGPVTIPALNNVGVYTHTNGATSMGFYRTRAQ